MEKTSEGKLLRSKNSFWGENEYRDETKREKREQIGVGGVSIREEIAAPFVKDSLSPPPSSFPWYVWGGGAGGGGGPGEIS